MNEPIRTQWQIRCAFNGFCKQTLKREAINASNYAIIPLLSCCFNGLPESLKIKFFFVLLHSHFTQLHFTIHLPFEI